MWSWTTTTTRFVSARWTQASNLHPSEHTTWRSSRTKSRTHKRKSWRRNAFSLRLKIKHPRAACSLFSTSVKKSSLQEKCPANWFVKTREGVRRETGREISLFFQSRQVKCAVRPRQWNRPFTCKDEVYGASRVLWPVFRLQLRGTKAWRYPLPSHASHFSLLSSPLCFLPSFSSTLSTFPSILYCHFSPVSPRITSTTWRVREWRSGWWTWCRRWPDWPEFAFWRCHTQML